MLTELSNDSFTGLPNLFGLVESATTGAFTISGTIVAADIAYLEQVNQNYGRRAGDGCVRALARLLRDETLRSVGSRPAAFRIGGDEFVLVLPGYTQEEAQLIAYNLGASFRKKAIADGILGVNLHTAVVTYEEKGLTAATLVKAAYLALADCRYTAEIPAKLPKWVEGLIDNMAERIYETLGLLRETYSLALSDEISGLPNHRAAELYLEEMFTEYRQSNFPFAILFIDGDNLRQYNDLGYEQGNRMIHELGLILAGSLRQGDRLTRWLSGDEFMALIPGADRKLALQVAERIRLAVEAATRNWPTPITVSIGVAVCPEDAVTAPELLEKAENAITAAKKTGKNQVV